MTKINLASPNYVLRTLEPADAAFDWGVWTTEPHAVRMLNIVPQHLSQERRLAYIASFDTDTRHAMGMFAKSHGRMVGLTTLHINKSRREFLINVLTGDPDDRNKGARTETRIVLYQYLFEELGMLRAHCSTLAHNEANVRSMERRGWQRVRVSQRPSVVDGTQLDVCEYTLDRDTWRRIGG